MNEGRNARGTLRRREFVIAGAASGLTLAGPINYAALARALKVPLAADGKFAHGVAAGFPSPTGATLWTRVSELQKSSRLNVEVAKDKHFKNVVSRSEVVADATKDFTVHAHVAGLKPANEYYYRFH